MRDFAGIRLAFIANPNDRQCHAANRSGDESEPGKGTTACALETWKRCNSGALKLLYISRRSG